jgi:hypothetical protein
MIVHGDPSDAALLVKDVLILQEKDAASNKAKPREPFHSVFCPEPIAPAIEALGFHPFKKEPEWVVLFEKRF